MVEIEFSVMEGAPGEANNLLPLLKAFKSQYNIQVNLTAINWHKGWTDIAKFGIFGTGPDVSCIGTTWVGSLASMRSLRPFTPQQVRSLGGADAFFESSWQSGFLPKDPTPWAIPWLGDALVMYYWKDMFEKACIKDVQAAFASDEAILETLKILQRSGIPYPLALTTNNIPMILHEAAHWIWNAGGSLMDNGNQKVTFNAPAALEGWKKYFSLREFISPETLTVLSVGDLFKNRDAAIHLGRPWMGLVVRYENPECAARLGVVTAPGATYVGGASFVIWQYSLHNYEAFELVRFLSSQPAPTRRNAINMQSAETDIFHHIYMESLQNGKSFPTIRLWGSIEDKLINTTANIWKELFENPNQDLEKYLNKHLDPLAERLNILLEN